jgi:hypothetical protein
MRSFNFEFFINNFFVEDNFEHDEILEDSAIISEGNLKHQVRIEHELTEYFRKQLNNATITVVEVLNDVYTSFEFYLSLNEKEYILSYRLDTFRNLFNCYLYEYTQWENAYVEILRHGDIPDSQLDILLKYHQSFKSFLMENTGWRLIFITDAIEMKDKLFTLRNEGIL